MIGLNCCTNHDIMKMHKYWELYTKRLIVKHNKAFNIKFNKIKDYMMDLSQFKMSESIKKF